MIVYDLDGNAHEKEPVDCRECVKEMGWSLTAPAPEVAEEAPAPEAKKGK